MSDVIVVIGGNPFVGWKKVDVDIQFDRAANNATVTLTETPTTPMPARLFDEAVVLINGTPVVTGMVHDISASHDWSTHEINVTIRDKTQDLVDSTIGPKQEHKPPITLKQVLQKTIGKMGLPIGVIDKVGPPPFRPSELVNGNVDTSGFNFCDNWARGRQCVLNTDGKGNLVIDRNMGRMGPGALIKTFEDNPANNVLKAQFKNTSKDRHNQKSVAGQKSPTDRYWEGRPKGDPPAQAKPISTNVAVARDSGVPPQRKQHTREHRPSEGRTPMDSANWKANLARARGVTYTATVQGFGPGGFGLWWPGYIIPVLDAHFELATPMFIKGVKFHKDWDGGSTTELECTVPDAFTLNASSAPIGGQRGASFGLGYSGPGRFA